VVNPFFLLKPPIQPSLPLVFLSLIACALPLSVPQCLCGHESIMQNKPNSQKPKTNATSYATKNYTTIPPRSAQKNKPKSNPIYRGEASGEAGTNPCPRPQTIRYPARNTQYEIRHPTSDIRNTRYASRFTPAPWGRNDLRHTTREQEDHSRDRLQQKPPIVFRLRVFF